MKEPNQSQDISLSYSLFDLPTAQHKAGLAGLLLLIDSMRQREIGPLPAVIELASTSVKLTFGQGSLQAVFDEFYDAELTEAQVKTKWKGRPLKREGTVEVTDSKTGTVKQVKTFIYDVVVPKASCLKHHYPGDERGWLKLWRDMLWNTLRGRPTTQFVYVERAEKRPSTVAPAVWKDLVKHATGIKTGKLVVGEVPSSLFIGAQARNAERVPFSGRVDENLLLHFWPLTSLIFVPQVISREGNGRDKGFVLSIPEVSDLVEFLDVFPRLLSTLDPQLRGYRPRASVIDLPAEGGLEFFRNLSLVARQKTEGSELKYSVSAIELYHLDKQGNNIKVLAADRVVPRRGLLSQYEGIRSFCRNPLFKSQLLMNLLHGLGWHEGFTRLFAVYPWEFFLQSEKTPATIPYFSSDVRKKFRIVSDEYQHQLEAYAMPGITEAKPQSLEKRIYEMIGAYVWHRAEVKSGIKYADFKDKKTIDGKMDVPSPYRDAKQKVCADAFLAIRSRRDQDFIEYFTGTICSVPQFLRADDYVFVSQALLEADGWEKIKTLSMLALSAHS